MPTESLNAVCPYYTMYPLEFPLRVLRRRTQRDEWILDPFCGRGTTNFAARLLGLCSVGIDSSPIAVAIAQAKLLHVDAKEVVSAAESILREGRPISDWPHGEFWRRAYHPATLEHLCQLREALLESCLRPERIVLRAILLGALHGPRTKGEPSYFSNQSPRTFAPKPRYATRFWRERALRAPRVDVLAVVRRRAQHYLTEQPAGVCGLIVRADSRNRKSFEELPRFRWVITSPPYYGMRTYISDQWLRNWFLGGPSRVNYQHPTVELAHGSAEDFAEQLAAVWRNVAGTCADGAALVCRFGALGVRAQDPLGLILASFCETPWRITTVRDAGTASNGKRQAAQFGVRGQRAPLREYDVYARLRI